MKKFCPELLPAILFRLFKPVTTAVFAVFAPILLYAQPVINTFAPTSGPAGTVVTISGNNFDPLPANNIVLFGGMKSTVLTASATSLTAVVPVGATYGNISVTTDKLTAYSSKPFTVAFSSFNAEITTASFYGRTDIPISSSAGTMTVADMDGDGKLDITAGSPQALAISVYRNTGTSDNLSFAGSDFPLGFAPVHTLAADLDGDGKPEILATNATKIAIYRNSSTVGSIAFGDSTEITHSDIDFLPERVSIHDMNGDGMPDIVVQNGNGYLSILKNTTVGNNLSFIPEYEMPGVNNKDVCVTDVDGDAKPDVILANNLTNKLIIYRNTSATGNINLTYGIELGAGQNTIAVKAADIDGDGKQDLCAINADSRTVSVFRNTSSLGALSFAGRRDFATGTLPVQLSISDINGDGKPDIAVANNASNSVTVLRNVSLVGAVSFGAVNIAVNTQPQDVITEDLDNDGYPDLLTSHANLSSLSFFRSKVLAPRINSFSPASAGEGSIVKITGRNLTPSLSVTFGGIAASEIRVISDTQVNARIGTGASGDVVLNTTYGSATSTGFTFVPMPVISSFSPVSGTVADTITITGTDFTTATSVKFGGLPATSFSVESPTTIKAVVGRGQSGAVQVSTIGGTASLAGFTYNIPPPPVITSFVPQKGYTGETITITGIHLASANSVSFGGTPAESFQVISPTTILAVIGSGSSGNLSVTTDGGTTDEPGFEFAVAPVITSFTPLSGPVGTTVTITGSNFDPVASRNLVYFGNTKANVISGTANSITVAVPAGATHHPISVTSYTLTAFSSRPFTVTFPGIGNIFTPGSFSTLPNLPAGTAPNEIAVGDLDGDGKSDVANANHFDGTISVYRNISTAGAIAFAPKTDLPITQGFELGGVEISDVNGDGLPEIISASNRGVALILKNTSTPGNISFAPAQSFSIREGASAIAAGDVDSDGKIDVVFASGYYLSVIRNTGTNHNLSFEAPLSIEAGYACSDVAIYDLDADNKPDIAITSSLNSANNTGKVSVFRNLCTPGAPLSPASFAAKIDLPTGNTPTGVIMSDLNNDDRPDLVVTSYPALVTVYENVSSTGTISFEPRKDYTVGSIPYNLSIADFDGDGKPDIATSNFGSQNISILKNNSTLADIAFAAGVDYPGSGGQLVSIRGADMDNDGKPDIVASDYSRDFVAVLRNTVAEAQLVPAGANPVTGGVIKITHVQPAAINHRGRVYVQRHYDVEPVNNPGSSTARVVLYFTQQEFDNYNMQPGHGLNLPQNPADAAGIAALRVCQFHGTSTTYLPGSYTGDSVEIDPEDANIVWNAAAQWWEVSFDVEGFSGFFISSAGNDPLPLQLLTFDAGLQGMNARIAWSTTNEINVSHFELERSTDNSGFIKIADIPASNTYNGNSQYRYVDALGTEPVYYYRLKIVDIDGKFALSKIIKVEQDIILTGLKVIPNPVTTPTVLVKHPVAGENAVLKVYDITGKPVKVVKVRTNSYQSV